MTEDDTFRILARKTSPTEIKKIAIKELPFLDTLEQADALLRKYGWTLNELEIELGVPEEQRSYYKK